MQVSGDVTMATASALFKDGLKPSGNSNMVIDFSQLEKVDSSAVSLMLVWLREARRSNIGLRFEKVPDNLASLARLYGVADLLPLQPAE
jgi:phospholipid transport system transporter-binding protein